MLNGLQLRPMHSNFLEIAKHFALTFFLGLLLAGGAVGLSYVVDFLHATNRPQWLIIGVDVVTIILAVMDAILVVSVAGIALWRAIEEFARKK